MSKTQKKPVAVKSAVTKKPAAIVAKGKEAKKPFKDAKPVKPEAKASSTKATGVGGSKQSILIAMLERTDGATVEEMAKTTGWQNHSVLGAISGVLKKRLGLTIASEKEERGRVYRIAGRR